MMKYIYIVLLCFAIININFGQSSQMIQPDLWLKKKVDLETRGLEKTGLLNFNEAYVFDGNGNYEEIPFNLDQASRFTFISVFHCLDSVAERAVWGAVNSSRGIMLSTQRVSGPKKIISYSNQNTTVPVLNTTIQYWGKAKGEEAPPAIWLGHPGDGHEEVQPFVGLIPEYMVFNRILREEQRRQVETYMAIKYGLTLRNSPYITSVGEVIWDHEKDQFFAHRIAGIGRDDAFELHQRQSASTDRDNVLTIGAKRVALTNTANEASLENMDFLVWGDNGEPFQLSDEFKEVGADFQLVGRHWKLNSAGTSAHTIATQLIFDISALEIPQGHRPWLVINRTGNNSFKARDLEFIEVEAVTSDGRAIFNDVQWDVDQSSSDVFTLAIGPSQIPLVKSFDLFPNPSNGDYQIDITLQEPGRVDVEIFAVNGRLVQRMEGEAQETYRFQDQLDEAGVYLVKIRTEQGSITKELIVVE